MEVVRKWAKMKDMKNNKEGLSAWQDIIEIKVNVSLCLQIQFISQMTNLSNAHLDTSRMIRNVQLVQILVIHARVAKNV